MFITQQSQKLFLDNGKVEIAREWEMVVIPIVLDKLEGEEPVIPLEWIKLRHTHPYLDLQIVTVLRSPDRYVSYFLTASRSRSGAVLVIAFSCVYSKSWSIKFHKHKMTNIMVNQILYYSVHIEIMVNQISLEVFI